MKLNRIITLCAVAATLAFSMDSLLAQDNGNNNGGQGGQGQGGGRRQRGGGQGGQGGQNGGNFDPAQFRQQMQERMLQGYQDQLGFTNDTEWDAVKPLVQKVMDARMDNMGGQFGGMGRMFSNRNRGGNNGDQTGNNNNNNRQRGGMGGLFQQSPEAEALQKAIDDNAPKSQIKDLLKKYQAAQKIKQAKLESAQADLRKVLDTTQEAQATLIGLLN